MPNSNDFKTHEEYLNYYRKYREKNKKKIGEYNKKYNKEYRHKYGYKKDGARIKLFRAIEKGVMKRAFCEICGKEGAEGHHFDYSKPLEVVWLCPFHHKDMHRKKKI